MVKIFYIILTWNSEAYIKECLDSIYAVKSLQSKVVVVDNGSKDGTRQILTDYVKTNHKNEDLKTVFLDKNYGTTYSRNIGLKLVSQDFNYVCVLDSDAQVNEKALNILIHDLEHIDGCGIIGPQLISHTSGIQLSGRHFPTLTIKLLKACPLRRFQLIGEKMEKYPQKENEESYAVDYLMSACWLFKSELLDKVGYLDEKIFYAPEDVEYCIRVWKRGYKVVFCPQAKIIHEWQRISKKKLISKMNFEHIKGLIYLFKKYGYLFNANKIKYNGVK